MRIIRKPAIAAAAAGLAALGVGVAAPAQATPVDRPLINTPLLDLGWNYAGGQPVTGAYLHWFGTTSIRPTLTGKIRVRAGSCGRIRIDYYDNAHRYAATGYSPLVCGPQTNTYRIGNYSRPRIAHVHITLELQKPNGTFVGVAAVAEDM